MHGTRLSALLLAAASRVESFHGHQPALPVSPPEPPAPPGPPPPDSRYIYSLCYVLWILAPMISISAAAKAHRAAAAAEELNSLTSTIRWWRRARVCALLLTAVCIMYHLMMLALVDHPNFGESDTAKNIVGICINLAIVIPCLTAIFGTISLRRMRAGYAGQFGEQYRRALRKCEAEESSSVCSFNFVRADYLKASTLVTLPTYHELAKEDGALVQRTIVRDHSFTGVYLDEYLAVSHRWLEQSRPDAEGHQLAAIRAYLAQHPHVQYVWYDFWCMPQGQLRTPAERLEFLHMLKHINLCFLGMRVLILLDLSYVSRFWVRRRRTHPISHATCFPCSARPTRCSRRPCPTQTQYEAWLSLQRCTRHGLQPAPVDERRCTIVPILNANDDMCDGLLSMWDSKTPAQAHSALAQPDVTVTNLKDKEQQLAKLLSLQSEVEGAMRHVTGWLPGRVLKGLSNRSISKSLLVAFSSRSIVPADAVVALESGDEGKAESRAAPAVRVATPSLRVMLRELRDARLLTPEEFAAKLTLLEDANERATSASFQPQGATGAVVEERQNFGKLELQDV